MLSILHIAGGGCLINLSTSTISMESDPLVSAGFTQIRLAFFMSAVSHRMESPPGSLFSWDGGNQYAS